MHTGTEGNEDAIGLLKVDPAKIIDLILSKQNQYYALWAGYTAVQFATASFGGGSGPSLGIAIAVLCGVWTFNLGHLGFVLRCSAQLDKLSAALDAAMKGDETTYGAAVKSAFTGITEGEMFWRRLAERGGSRSYGWNCFVHLFIDSCASVALLLRVDDERLQRLFGITN